MGKVYFVGAGSGASDLITVRGQELLRLAGVIIYAGSLVNPALLENARPGCLIYDSSRMTLDSVAELMISSAREGKTVVRLHTGDPSIYGAVREQMDRLEAAGIEYEICPGVSSFCGAAAALRCEYTLPGVSQTLILTRMEGRTPVPGRESIRALAAHGASMAVFLSASMTEKLQEELLAGGTYSSETPCAIVYKATWPEERVIRTTVGRLSQSAADAGIKKTALILVGEFLGGEYELSRLYDPLFSTGYRRAADENESAERGRKVINAAIICYTDRGGASAERIAAAMRGMEGYAVNSAVYIFSKDAGPDGHDCGKKYFSDTGTLAREIFAGRRGKGEPRTDAVIFVSAAGIAVRAAAPFLRGKAFDPAVIVVDDNANYVIPLLSGHIGGANRLAEALALQMGAEAVITTASDGAGVRAADMMAEANGFAVEDMNAAKRASAAALKSNNGKCDAGIVNKNRKCVLQIGDEAVKLRSLRYTIGIGCKKNTPPEKMVSFVSSILEDAGIESDRIYRVASIDIKTGESAIKMTAERFNAPFYVYSPEELNNLSGEFTGSSFVESVTGTDNVCERSAAAACGGRYKIIVNKRSFDGMTAAVAERLDSAEFEEGENAEWVLK